MWYEVPVLYYFYDSHPKSPTYRKMNHLKWLWCHYLSRKLSPSCSTSPHQQSVSLYHKQQQCWALSSGQSDNLPKPRTISQGKMNKNANSGTQMKVRHNYSNLINFIIIVHLKSWYFFNTLLRLFENRRRSINSLSKHSLTTWKRLSVLSKGKMTYQFT